MQITNLNDPYDAISFENLKASFEIMRALDELRLADENFAFMNPQASVTNFATMASAIVSADRAAGTFAHTTFHTMAEGLAWGWNPVYLWYSSEKAVFDSIKEELGITEVKSQSDVSAIENKANARGEVVQHYTYLFLAANEIMGVGHTNYNRTSSYGVTPIRYSGSAYTYAFEDFEELLSTYMNTLDLETLAEQAQ